MADTHKARPWRESLADFDPEGAARVRAWMEHVGSPETGGIDALTRELIFVATSTAVSATPSIATHVLRAVGEGATEQQIYQAMALGATSSGIPNLAAGLAVLDDVLKKGQ